MPIRTRVLVVANQTADSEGLATALGRRDDAADTEFTVLVPATRQAGRGPGFAAAHEQLDRALAKLRGAGLSAEGQVGDPDPVVAVHEIWNPGAFDHVIVSTLSRETSRWLEYDLPHRIARLTDCSVEHVVPGEIERELARIEAQQAVKREPPRRALGPFVSPSA
jgi:GABA permease